METENQKASLLREFGRYGMKNLRKMRSAYSLFRQIHVWSYLRYDRKILLYKKAHFKLHKTCRLVIADQSLLRIGTPWDPLISDYSFRPFGVDVYHPVFFDTHFVTSCNSYVELAENFELVTGSLIRVQQNGRLRIGKNFFLNSFSVIYCYEEVRIGNDVIIGSYTQIRDSDSHTLSYSGCKKQSKAPIVIEDHVWIASRVVILKGVTIGTGSVIAAGSVVTKDIPPHCLAGGNPARILRENISWKR